jgi:fido (protein-threonine AMPylation protein)
MTHTYKDMSSAVGDFQVTSQGINALLHQFPEQKGPLILRAKRHDCSELFLLSDDQQELQAIFLPSACQKVSDAVGEGTLVPTSDVLLKVLGVVVSMYDHLPDAPLLVVANAIVVSAVGNRNQRRRRLLCEPKMQKADPSQVFQGGLCFKFLKEYAPFLSNDELAGTCPLSRTLSQVNTLAEHKATVFAFLEHHDAICTLHRSQSHGTGLGGGNENITESYLVAMKDFEVAQMCRQKASLTSNAGKESAEGAALIVEQYTKALEHALSCPVNDHLSVGLLCEWHAILCKGTHKDAGKLRRKKNYVGSTRFRPPELVKQDLEAVCQAVRALESRLLMISTRDKDRGTMAATFASSVFLGIVDVHPFADGNGRLSRIALNWALRRAGVPFVIHLFATQTQRFDYTHAIKLARRNTCLESRGYVSEDQLLGGYRSAGALFPLVQLITSRLAKSVTEFHAVLKEKSSQRTEIDDVLAAKRFRLSAAQGNCLICFDDNPNIATLCCGKAVHLNCMAEWLSQRNSCPQCRNELPYLATRLRAPPADDAQNDAPDFTESLNNDGWDETTVDPDASYEHESSEPDSSEETFEPPRPNVGIECCFCRNIAARDCENSCCGRCCLVHGTHGCTRHNT